MAPKHLLRFAILLFSIAALPALADSHLGGCLGLTVQLRPDGTVWTAGLNNHGQLGDGAIGGSSSVPVQVVGLNAIKAISVGDNYVVALDASGVLWAWGADSALVLGPGATGDSGTPLQVTGLPPIRFVSAGHAHVLAIDQTGAVWTWGTASAGEMGPNVTATATPVQVTIPATPSAVKEVAAGYDFSLALLGTGKMMAWGNGANGGLGGSLSSTSTPTAWLKPPPGVSYAITHIVAYKQGLALQANGTVLSWGYGGAYGTGLGRASNTATPTVIPGLSHIKEVVVMGDNSGAIDSAGQLWLWGGNEGASMGLGISGPVETPNATGITGMTSLGGASDHLIANGPAIGIIDTGSNSNGQLAIGAQGAASDWEQSFFADNNGYSAVAAGNGFTLALFKDGSVHSVGRNDVGELGLGTSGGFTTADAQIPNLTNIIALAAGDRFALALRADGTVFSWGNNDYGQLANGNTLDIPTPVQVAGLTGISMIAAGADHAIAVSNTGSVFVWGRSNHYELGLGNLNEVFTPTQLTGFTGTPLAVSASGDHTLLLTTTGLYSFGSNGSGECGQGSIIDIQVPTLVAGLSNVAQIAAGRHHSLVLTSSGQIQAFGDDSAGELGDNATTNQTTPETITLPSYFNFPPSSIAAGNMTSFVADAWGDILGAGLNASGQLGEASSSGANVTSFSSVGGVGMQIAAGYNHVVLLYPGYLSLAGDNGYGELDNGSTNAAPISYFASGAFQSAPTTDSYIAVAAGAEHSLAIDESGRLWGWGDNSQSELGDGARDSQLSPTLTAASLNLIQVAAGFKYSIGIDASGHVWGWGLSNADQAGTNGNSGGMVPQELNFSGAIQVSAGYDDTLILRDDGTVWAVGDNYHGYLTSTLATPSQLAPAQIPGLSNIVAVSTGQYFSLALGSNGSVYSFGYGTSGQLGNGQWSNETSVVTASAISSATGIAAGNSHSLAVDAAGNCWAWGSGYSGQNGSASYSAIATPVKLAPTGALTPAAGADFTEFLLANGTVVGFGNDTSNQLDDYQYIASASPLVLDYVGPLTALAAGSAHSIGILGYNYAPEYESPLESWGDDTFGQLGNGVSYTSPPGTPANFTATLNASIGTEIDLAWTAVGKPASGYIVEESTDQSTWTAIGYPTGSATTYHATGLATGTTYYFQINAVNAGGASGFAQASQATGYVTPSIPVISSVTANNGSLTITWTDTDPTSNVKNITIEEANPDGTYTTLATLSGNPTSYTITGVPTGSSLSNIVVAASNSSGSATSTSVSVSNALTPVYRYGAIDLGASFVPYKIANNGTMVGADAKGNLARWTFNDGAADLTVAHQPFPISASITGLAGYNFASNNSGQVVATYNTSSEVIPGEDHEGLFWDVGNNDAAITAPTPVTCYVDAINPIAGLIRWDGKQIGTIVDTGTLAPGFSDLEFTAIDDSGTIYGYQLTQLVGSSSQLQSLVTVTSSNPGEWDILGGFSVGIGPIWALTIYGTYDNSQGVGSNSYDPTIHYGLVYDGFTDTNGKISTLDKNAVQINGNQFTVTVNYPLLASSGTSTTSGVRVDMPYSITDTLTSNLSAPLISSGTPVTGGIPLGFSPVAVNNSGDILGLGVILFNGAGSATPFTIASGNGTTDSALNSRMTAGIDDCQILQSGSLVEKSRDANGNPVLPYLSYSVASTVPLNLALSIQRTTCINDQGVIGGAGYAAAENGTVDVDSNGNPRPHGVLMFPAELAVDANRDGTIVMANDPVTAGGLPVDTTSQFNPFTFWVNDGTDWVNPESGVQEDENPANGAPNWTNGKISYTRNLENFARLWLYTKGMNSAIASGQIVVGLEWDADSGDALLGWGPNDGAPSINIYSAVDGTTGYLTDSTTAKAQVAGAYGVSLGTVSKGHPFYFTPSTLAGLSDANPKLYFLFEAAARGSGRLVMTFNTVSSNGTLTKIGLGGSVYMNLKETRELYERWTVGDGPPAGTLSTGGGGAPAPVASISQDRLPPGVPALQYSSGASGLSVLGDPTANDYILFVHGWNMAPWEKDAFAATMMKRLYWQGYKGKFGTFQWPTTYSVTDWEFIEDSRDKLQEATSYDDGEYAAWQSSIPLENLLSVLNKTYGNRFFVLAHSMGNVVAGEALRIAGQGGQTLVNTYIASQAAVPGHCYDPTLTGTDLVTFYPPTINLPITPNVYNNWMMPATSGAASKINLFNVNDYALYYWNVDQVLKPDQREPLGWDYGYNTYGKPLTTLQDNFYKNGVISRVNLHLGTAAKVLDRYEIMAYASQPYSRALGEVPDAKGFSSQNLQPGSQGPKLWPPDMLDPTNQSYSAHPWHSAEFLFANSDMMNYWHYLLQQYGIQPTSVP